MCIRDRNNIVGFFQEAANAVPFCAEGALVALKLSALTLVFALPLGLVMAAGRMSRFKLIQYPVRFLLLLLRGTPLMLQLLVLYFGPDYIVGLSWDCLLYTSRCV